MHTVIRFVSINSKFGIWTVVGLNGTLVEAKIRTFKCHLDHDGTNTKFSTKNWDETDYNAELVLDSE